VKQPFQTPQPPSPSPHPSSPRTRFNDEQDRRRARRGEGRCEEQPHGLTLTCGIHSYLMNHRAQPQPRGPTPPTSKDKESARRQELGKGYTLAWRAVHLSLQ